MPCPRCSAPPSTRPPVVARAERRGPCGEASDGGRCLPRGPGDESGAFRLRPRRTRQRRREEGTGGAVADVERRDAGGGGRGGYRFLCGKGRGLPGRER